MWCVEILLHADGNNEHVLDNVDLRKNGAECLDQRKTGTENAADHRKSQIVTQVDTEGKGHREERNVDDALENHRLDRHRNAVVEKISILHEVEHHVKGNQDCEVPEAEHCRNKERRHKIRRMERGDIVMLVSEEPEAAGEGVHKIISKV